MNENTDTTVARPLTEPLLNRNNLAPLKRDVFIEGIDYGRHRGLRGGGRLRGLGCSLALTQELDLVDNQVKFRMTLTVLVPCRIAEFAFDSDLLPLREKIQESLGSLPEHGAVDEVAALIPLARLPVAHRGVEGQGE